MERERFLSLCFRPYMELWYVNNRMRDGGYTYIPVMMLAVDYDNDTFRVIPFPNDPIAEEVEFWTSRDHIELPTKRMKVILTPTKN